MDLNNTVMDYIDSGFKSFAELDHAKQLKLYMLAMDVSDVDGWLLSIDSNRAMKAYICESNIGNAISLANTIRDNFIKYYESYLTIKYDDLFDEYTTNKNKERELEHE